MESNSVCNHTNAGADPGEVKWVNFHPPFSELPSFFFFLIPQILKKYLISLTLLQKFTPPPPPFQNPGSALGMITNRTTSQRESDLFITSMITDRIGRHKVLSSINHTNCNFREKKNSKVMKEKNCMLRLAKEA